MQTSSEICESILTKYAGRIELLPGEGLLYGIARICPEDYNRYLEAEQQLFTEEELELEEMDRDVLLETVDSYVKEMTDKELCAFIREREAEAAKKRAAKAVSPKL